GETLSQFLDAHERAFDYFGGHTREHLYDRPRTVCQPGGDGRVVWNATFKQFADYWGFEPHLCRAYRAQTKGKVEAGVKYFKGNFLPGRTFVDEQDLLEQLGQWQREIADVRIHGTTHERPADRFARERSHLIATAGQPGFRLEASQARRVAEDYLVSFETNRYSVPFTLIGQTVEVARRSGRLHITHRGGLVAEHEELPGKHQLRIRPEHGPGAIARTARRIASALPTARGRAALPEVEVRDLAIYEALGAATGATDIAPLMAIVDPEAALPGGTLMSAAQLERLQEQMQRLRLFKSRERLEALLQEATAKEASYADFLDTLLAEEVASKTAKHVTMRTHLARFPFVKSLETFDFSYQPSLDKKQIQTLSSCHFIEHGEN